MAHYQDNSAGNGKVEPAHNDSPDNSLKEIDTELSRNIADRINKISINIKLNDLSQLKDELYEIYDLLVSSRNAYIQIGDPNTRNLLPIKFSHNQTSFGDPSYSFEIGLRDKSSITDQDVSDAALIFNLICDLIEPQNSRLYTDVAEINKASFIPVDHGSHTLTLLEEPFVMDDDDNRFESIGPTASFHFHRGSGDLCGPKLLSALLNENSAMKLVILKEKETEFVKAKGSELDFFVVEDAALELSVDTYVNRTPRFVLPIPDLGAAGELLICPKGDEREGEAIKTNEQGDTERGVVFFNGADNAWQGVRGNGKEAILINSVSKQEALLLKAKFEEIQSKDKPLTVDGIKELLSFARNDLGLVDFYNKKLETIDLEMSPPDLENPYYRVVTKPTLHKAVYIQEPFLFNGPVLQEYPQGAVLVTDGKNTWGVATKIFIRNFKRLVDEKEYDLSSVDELYAL